MYSGPTIGRRRSQVLTKVAIKGGDKKENSSVEASQSEKKKIEAFSIGGEFDFLGSANDDGDQPLVEEAFSSPPPPPPKEKDDLMDALNALDDVDDEEDEHSHVPPPEPMQPEEAGHFFGDDKTEEVVFDLGGDDPTIQQQETLSQELLPSMEAPVNRTPAIGAPAGSTLVECDIPELEPEPDSTPEPEPEPGACRSQVTQNSPSLMSSSSCKWSVSLASKGAR